ncbi:MAG: exodeoxyribonuclease VII small subunit [Spirochaetaceae bacterium]|jgi:exodeoxyribonuclease VII small subunit|nr:exodeoxyribonuclease VII small subunit [Spirochaetaceae bacterium]
MKNFEQRLEKLELLGEKIRSTEVSLDDALNAFEEGIKLARSLENDLEKIENRIEVLTNGPEDTAEKKPEAELFDLE